MPHKPTRIPKQTTALQQQLNIVQSKMYTLDALIPEGTRWWRNQEKWPTKVDVDHAKDGVQRASSEFAAAIATVHSTAEALLEKTKGHAKSIAHAINIARSLAKTIESSIGMKISELAPEDQAKARAVSRELHLAVAQIEKIFHLKKHGNDLSTPGPTGISVQGTLPNQTPQDSPDRPKTSGKTKTYDGRNPDTFAPSPTNNASISIIPSISWYENS